MFLVGWGFADFSGLMGVANFSGLMGVGDFSGLMRVADFSGLMGVADEDAARRQVHRTGLLNCCRPDLLGVRVELILEALHQHVLCQS